MHTYIIYKYISSTVNKLLMWHNKRHPVSLGIRGEAHSRNLKQFGAGNPLKGFFAVFLSFHRSAAFIPTKNVNVPPIQQSFGSKGGI